MGRLFPNSAEYPDYVPMPEPFLEAVRLGLPPLMIAALIAISITDDQPLDQPHIHYEIQQPVHVIDVLAISTGGSASGDGDVPMLSWRNNSTEAADILIRNHNARRNAYAALMAGMSSTNGALFHNIRSSGPAR